MGDNQRLVEEMLFARVVEAALKHLHRPTLKTILRLPELKGRLLGAYLTQPTRSGKESPESKAIRKTALDLYLEMCREMGSPPGKIGARCGECVLHILGRPCSLCVGMRTLQTGSYGALRCSCVSCVCSWLDIAHHFHAHNVQYFA